MIFTRRLPCIAFLLATLTIPHVAQAWWNPDFQQRTQITLNTGPAGVTTSEAVNGVAVPVRLHSGNFDFIAAKPDGSDLRVLAADDKTPLTFSVERYDGNNELAVLWVQVPTVAPGSDKNVLFVYAGNDKASAEAGTPVADSGALLTLRFTEKDGLAGDVSGSPAATIPVALEVNGLIGASARFDGKAGLALPADPRVAAVAGAPYSVVLWTKPADAGGNLFTQGPLTVALEAGRVAVRFGALRLTGGDLPVSAWAQIGLTIGNGQAVLYVNGAEASKADLPTGLPAINGAVRIGEGYNGQIDEVQVAGVLRSPEWMKFSHAAQGADAKLVAAQLEREGEGSGIEDEQAGYIGLLMKNLSVDAWVVMIILGAMFVVALWVMVVKTLLVVRTDRGNQAFIQAFRSAPDVLVAGGASQHTKSSLARLYDAGLLQLTKRQVGQANAPRLSGASMDAVKASVDAELVRESHKINSQMVLLTIAISGGPFLGMLGTVIGVMITFAAIAAAGDVNVNAIAPGIAAALLTTVAGLAVAIPALFGYNWLASRIKSISADMQIFVDEFVTRVAESYGER